MPALLAIATRPERFDRVEVAGKVYAMPKQGRRNAAIPNGVREIHR
jgi:hypothetical protein